jgi:hypothetical protein
VRAFNFVGNSSYSNTGTAKTWEDEDAVLVPTGSIWKFLDNGSNQETEWRESSFDDSAWQSGPAKLGYGDNDEATVVSYGPSPGNKYITTYFRHSFNVADPSAFASLILQILRDDGLVIYLNGTEIWRNSMPAGDITHTTRAAVATEALDFLEVSISSSQLLTGTNVIAVEVHQIDTGSSDLALDLQLIGSDVTIGLLRQDTSPHFARLFRSLAGEIGLPINSQAVNLERPGFEALGFDSFTPFSGFSLHPHWSGQRKSAATVRTFERR